jgi:hypothetical protein
MCPPAAAGHPRETGSQMGQRGASQWRRGIVMLGSRIRVTHNLIIYELIYFVKSLLSFLAFLT